MAALLPAAPLTEPGRPALPLATRFNRKLSRLTTTTQRRVRKWTARLVYSLPGLSRRDPRRRVVTFQQHCPTLTAYPPGGGNNPPDWYLRIRGATSVATTPSITADPTDAAAFAAGARQHQGGETLHYPEVFIAAISQARIYSSDYLLLSREGHIFFESALSRADYLEANGILDRILLPRSRHLDGEHWLLTNRSIRGYYHWLIDVLPKLSLTERIPELARLPLILPPSLGIFHQETLQLAGIVPARITSLEPGHWQADRIYFPEILGPTGIPSPHAVAWLRRTFLGPAATDLRGSRRVYLTRRDATQRRVLNEAEVIAMLAPLGFEVICPGDLTFAQQVELFRTIDVVIAPHGAGLTNMVFAGAGATLVEFFGDNYVNGCFWALAQHCRQRHACLTGPSTWLDYEVPLPRLKALLQKLGL